MKFIDSARVFLKSGDGGNGCVSFRREKYVPRGGPNGGDGGRGGNISFETDTGMYTLLDFKNKKHFEAKRGEHGRGNDQYGKGGEDIVIKVPLGTAIIDEATGDVLAELDKPNQQALICQGGKGGRGNMHFTSPTRQAPTKAEDGEEGEGRWVILELKLLADVGLIGFPNAGKSMLLSVISRAKPKVADYPFTTKTPVLGVVAWGDKSFTVADLPGLIEGASDGHGLGHQFLKHIEKTRVFLHLLAINDPERDDPWKAYQQIRKELKAYNPTFSKRPEVLVLTKSDLPDVQGKIKKWEAFFKKKKKKVVCISAATHKGIDALLKETAKIVFTK